MKFKKFCAFISVLLAAITLLSSCAFNENANDKNKTNLEKVDAVVEAIRTFNETYKDAKGSEAAEAKSKDKEKIKKMFDKLNFDYWNFYYLNSDKEEEEKFSITEADLELYLQTHSNKDFLTLVNDLYNWFSSEYHLQHTPSATTNAKCWCGAIEQMIGVFLSLSSDDLINLSKPGSVTSGYYIDNPDAFPQTRTEDIKNSTMSDHIKNTYTVTYFGDFALECAEEYIYDEGRLEWVDGVFYDEPESWEKNVRNRLYYKGNQLGGYLPNDMIAPVILCDGEIFSLLYTKTDDINEKHCYTEIRTYDIG